MSDLARLRIWDDPAIRGALSWYLDVAENRRPAKFRIAATVATGLHLVESSEDALWAELDRLTPIFLARWQAIRAGAPLPQAVDGPSVLELCRELAYRFGSPTAIFVRGIAASIGWRAPSSALASSPPVRGSARIFITPAKSCFIAARRAQARSSSPLATCGAPSARMGTSARTKTTARRRTRAHWQRWRGPCVAKVVTISIGSAVAHRRRRADASRGCPHWRDCDVADGASSLHRQGARAGRDLRGSGRHCHREHTPAQRDDLSEALE
jgi:hypothetical protein